MGVERLRTRMSYFIEDDPVPEHSFPPPPQIRDSPPAALRSIGDDAEAYNVVLAQLVLADDAWRPVITDRDYARVHDRPRSGSRVRLLGGAR